MCGLIYVRLNKSVTVKSRKGGPSLFWSVSLIIPGDVYSSLTPRERIGLQRVSVGVGSTTWSDGTCTTDRLGKKGDVSDESVSDIKWEQFTPSHRTGKTSPNFGVSKVGPVTSTRGDSLHPSKDRPGECPSFKPTVCRSQSVNELFVNTLSKVHGP